MSQQSSKRARQHAKQATDAFGKQWQRHIGEPRGKSATFKYRRKRREMRRSMKQKLKQPQTQFENWEGYTFDEWVEMIEQDGVDLSRFPDTTKISWWRCSKTADDIIEELEWELGDD